MAYTEDYLINKAVETFGKGKADFKIKAENCALLVIDMQNEFVLPEWTYLWIPEATRQVPVIQKMIKACRGAKIPVIYTIFSNTHNFLDRPKFGNTMPNRFPDLPKDEN